MGMRGVSSLLGVGPRGRKRALPLLACCGLLAAVSAVCDSQAHASTSPASKSVVGTISAVGDYQFTLKVPGAAHGIVGALTEAASEIGAQDWPYVWGGGHAVAGVPSIGDPGGSGYNGKRKGFDCSGSVAAVLVAGGLWPAGSSVPADNGVIAELKQQGLISRGPASGPGTVTLYDWPGHHIFMNIAGRFWGTSDGGTDANSKGGPGWLTGYPNDVTSGNFKAYHFLAAKLQVRTIAGEALGFTYPQTGTQVLGSFKPGSAVRVTYQQGRGATMVATAVAKARIKRPQPGPGTGGAGL